MLINDLAVDDVRNAFDYNTETGEMTWKNTRCPRVNNGDIAGTISSDGYRRVNFLGRKRAVHRMVWLHYYGENPHSFIDHINRDRLDNRIINLRCVTSSQNAQNRSISDETKGVSYLRGKWMARLCWPVKKYIGLFESEELAISAYKSARDAEINRRSV